MEIPLKSLTRSLAALSFSVLFFLGAFVRPALAQSDEAASSDSKAAISKLSVSPKSLSYSVDIDKGKFSETLHFSISNKGTLPLAVTVGAPTDAKNYVIQFPPAISPAGGTLTIAGSMSQEVDVEFIPHGPGKNEGGTIGITSNATSGESSATVDLKGSATQKNPTPTATATATPTASPTATTATATPTETSTPKALLFGQVTSEGNPVSNSSVAMWLAGTTGYGTGAIQLGATTSAADGSFAIFSACPAQNSQDEVYLTAQGGNAGQGSNSSLMMMATVGKCSSIFTIIGSTIVNEQTTVAGEWALAQFTDSTGQVIGAPASNATGLANAFNQAEVNLVDTVSGAPASFWSNQGATAASCTGLSPPVNCNGLERLNTIANILAACVESSGPSSNACSMLLSNTGSSTTTLGAAHAMATDPVANVATLFALQGVSPPFTPNLSKAPDGWEIALNFDPGGANFNGSSFLAIDADGNVWATNSNGNSVTELTSSGGLVGNFNNTNTSGANFSGPDGVAIDADGNVWVTNYSGDTVTELNSSGGLVGNFAPSGANFESPIQVAIDAADNAWVTNQGGRSVTELTSSGSLAGNFAPVNFQAPQFVAIDAFGNVWVTDIEASSVTILSSSGGIVGEPFSTDLVEPGGVAIDAGGNAWVANEGGNTVTEVTSSGDLAGNFAPGGAGFDSPGFVAIDADGNVWVTNFEGDSVTELTSSGGLAGNFAPIGAFNFPDGVAIDAAGNVWVANAINSVAEIVGAARPVLTPLVACLKQKPPHAVCLP